MTAREHAMRIYNDLMDLDYMDYSDTFNEDLKYLMQQIQSKGVEAVKADLEEAGYIFTE